jgi:endonuclease/exonuclease/phosphatase family metal-dependent hydrolase
MRRLALLVLLLALAGSCARASVQRPARTPAATSAATVRVLVYNIHAGKDAQRRPNLEDVARLVQEHEVDLALLQEVDRGTKRSGNVDQVRLLEEQAGRAAVFGRSLDFDGGQYGIAALARGGFVSHETRPLPVTPAQERSGGSYEPRAALVAVARTPAGEFQVVNTHLDASRDDHYRLQEAAHLLALAEPLRRDDRPLLLGGDLNSEPDSAVLERLRAAGLRDAWAECGRGAGLTFPSDAPVKRIDYLLLSGAVQCTAAVVLETTVSDHRPLLVTVVR